MWQREQRQTWATFRTLLGIAVLIALIVAPTALSDPASPFTITNIDSPDPVASGAELTYTITIVNTGGSKATEVVLTDQLNGVGGIGVPPQLAITSTRGSCTQSATLVTCNAGTIEGGGSWTVTIRGVVTAANGTTLNNTASVTGTRSAQNFTSTTTTTTLVSNGATSQLPDLTIDKNGPTAVAYGSQVVYSLIVNNQGLANATDVTVVDTVDSQLTDIIAQPLGTTSLFTCTVADHTVTCVGGRINQGANATITITGTAPNADTLLTNTASVDPFNTIPESNELNNTSALVNTQVMANPPLPPLSITKTDAKDPIVPGDIETYTVTVKNNAATRADDVVIVDGTQGLEAATLTATFDVTDGTIGNFGGCSVAAPQAKCVARTLNPGGTIVMTVSGKIVASAGTTLLNTSTVTGNIKNTGYSATATEKTTVKPAVDLTVTVADNPDPVCARSWAGMVPAPPTCRAGLEYTFTVGNSGINSVANVLVRAPLPPGVVYDAANSTFNAFTCSVDAQNVLTCTTAVLGPESTSVFKIMNVAPPVMGPISLTATVDPANAIFEADETNNSFTQVTQVITGVDLVTKVVDDPPGFDPIATSGTQTYTITVWNEGTQDASNIRLRQTLPSGTRFRDVIADPNHNFTCSYANGVIECVGGMLQGTASNNNPLIGGGVSPLTPRDTATILVRVFAQSFAGTMHTEVRVDPMNEIPEANEANNIAVQDTAVDSFVDGHGGFNQLTIKKDQTYPLPVGDAIARNAKMTWVITVGNTGTDPAVGITVRDFLPAGARYIEATGTNKFNCNQVGGHIDCVGGEIASAGTATITVSAFAPDTPAAYTNQAIVDPDNTIPEGDELENEAQAPFTIKNAGIKPFYELSITSPGSPAGDTTVPRNSVVTYTVTVQNGGTDDVIGVVVRDTLPAGSRYIEATGTNQFLCSDSSGVVTCVGGQILGTVNNSNNPGTATITIKMFAPDTPGPYVNQAIVDPMNTVPEGDEENNQWQVKTTVENKSAGSFNDLLITMSAPATVTPKGDLSYHISVSNAGSDPALGVAVRDPLPPDAIFVSAVDDDPLSTAKFTCNYAGGVVNCTGATLSGTMVTIAGAPPTRGITIHVTAPNSVIPEYKNQVFADPDNTIPEGDETNNTFFVTTSVQPVINLSIKKDGPDTAQQSDVKDYTITVKNNKASGSDGQTAFGVQVHDPMPVGLIPLAVDAGSGNNWACQILQNPINVVDCVGDLNPDQEVQIKVTVFVTAENNRSLDNEACVDPNNLIAEFDPGENDNCSTATMPVRPAPKKHPDLELTKTVSPASVAPGDTVTYTIHIENKGDAAAYGTVTVTDNMPSGLTVTSTNGTNGFTCTSTSPVICTKSDGLDIGASADLTIVASVSVDLTSGFANTAIAAQAQADPSDTTAENEFVLDNNTATVVSTVGGPKYDLAVTALVDNPDPAIRGQQLVYTVNAANLGSQPTTGVHVTLNLPSTDSVILSDAASGSNGWTCGDIMGNAIDCSGDLAAGANTAITVKFLVRLDAPANDLSFTATIPAMPSYPESTEDQANNTKTVTTSVTGGGCIPTPSAPCVDLAVVKFDGPATVAAGGTATYTFVLTNIGGAPAGPILSLAWFDLQGDVSSAAPVSNNPNVVCATTLFTAGSKLENTCDGSLQPGESATLTLMVTVNSGTQVSAFGTVDPMNQIYEMSDFEPGTCGNNCGQFITTVTP